MNRLVSPAPIGIVAVAALLVVGAPDRPSAQGEVPPLSPEALSLVCAARLAPPPAEPVLRIVGSRDISTHEVFGPGDAVVLSGGAVTALAPGQQYVVRRRFRARMHERHNDWLQSAVHTSGWVRVDSLHGDRVAATVVWACDGLRAGDYLEPFQPPSVPDALAEGTPDFAGAGRVLFDNDERRLASPWKLVLVERREGSGATPGQRVTFFRRLYGVDGPVSPLGTGTVMEVLPTALIVRVDSARDAAQYSGEFTTRARTYSVSDVPLDERPRGTDDFAALHVAR
jgi:hypothetical protein